MVETTVITFSLNNPFKEWANIFDSGESEAMHQEFGITPLYRGFDPSNPINVIVIHQAEKGQVDKFVEKYGHKFLEHGLKPETIKTSTWLSA